MTQDPPSRRADGFRNRPRPSIKGRKGASVPQDAEPTRPFKRPPPGPPRSESRAVLYLSIALALSIGLNIWQAGHWTGHSSATEQATQSTTPDQADAATAATEDTGESSGDTASTDPDVLIQPRRSSRDKGISAKYWLYFEKLEEAEKISGGPPSSGAGSGPPSAELIAGEIIDKAASGDFSGLDNYVSLHAVRIDAYEQAEPSSDCPELCHDHYRNLMIELQLGERILNELIQVREGTSSSTELAEQVGSQLLNTHRMVQSYYTELKAEKEQGSSP